MEKPINILDRLATSLGRRDEVPNQELALEIVKNSDQASIKILIENLGHKKSGIQNDCIKVLYEIGERAPALISAHIADFVALLRHKNNRLQWGGMCALDHIASVEADSIYGQLSNILDAAENGSVITRDHAVNILIKLAALPKYADTAFDLLTGQLLSSPTNQLPMYAERALPLVNAKNKANFMQALQARLDDIEKESKRKRVEKVLKKLAQ